MFSTSSTAGTWRDLLKYYDGENISVDAIGNLLKDEKDWLYTWRNGRELAKLETDSTIWTFTYDANGMRTKRTNGSTTYTYVYNGGNLSQMTVDGHTLRFSYDAQGPMFVKYDTLTYQYILNLQGDVIGIMDPYGSIVVQYTYDAWGNILSTTGSMASTLGQYNPLRYRGYVYDRETELYYLQTRYYNPEWGRFISADAFVATGQGFVGNNMFAYCLNNPVNGCDPCGTCLHRWDIWNDCENCKAFKNRVRDKANDAIDWVANKVNSIVEYVFNDDVRVAQNNLYENNISFYKGALVLSGDLPHDNAFSFGIIVMDTYYETSNIDTFTKALNHEYGHYKHMEQIGIVAYTTTTAIPSLIGAGITAIDVSSLGKFYYSQPWERIADHLGGVTGRSYISGADAAGSLYWLYTVIVGCVT